MNYADNTGRKTLAQWLDFIESLHPQNINMGLDRVQSVFESLELSFNNTCVITIAGTNGKGSTARVIELLLLALGRSVAVYSSPHILRYEERVRVNGCDLSAQKHVDAFEQVNAARGETALTYFEFGTLAGLQAVANAKCDYAILEIGLGGRLDAVNVVDPDIAVITTIDLDHMDWLGDTREKIGFEKAGILRKAIPFYCSDHNPPNSVLEKAVSLKCVSKYQNADYSMVCEQGLCRFESGHIEFDQLPQPKLPMQNVATALQVVVDLEPELNQSIVAKVLEHASLIGRFQQVASDPDVFIDVAHNPQSTRYLAQKLKENFTSGKIYAIAGMLKDKDQSNTLAPLIGIIDDWSLVTLGGYRGQSAEALAQHLRTDKQVLLFDSVEVAYDKLRQRITKNDRIIVFGSFITVEHLIKSLENQE